MWCYFSIFSVRQFSTTCGHQAMRQQLEKKKQGWHSYWHLADPPVAIHYCFYCCSDYFRRNSDAHTRPVSLQPHSIAHSFPAAGSLLWQCPVTAGTLSKWALWAFFDSGSVLHDQQADCWSSWKSGPEANCWLFPGFRITSFIVYFFESFLSNLLVSNWLFQLPTASSAVRSNV